MQVELNIEELSELYALLGNHSPYMKTYVCGKIGKALRQEKKNLRKSNERVMEALKVELCEKIKVHIMEGKGMDECKRLLDEYQNNLNKLKSQIRNWENM